MHHENKVKFVPIDIPVVVPGVTIDFDQHLKQKEDQKEIVEYF